MTPISQTLTLLTVTMVQLPNVTLFLFLTGNLFISANSTKFDWGSKARSFSLLNSIAQDENSQLNSNSEGNQDETAIAAWVDDTPISASDVDREVKQALRGRKVEGTALQYLKARAVEQLIGRELILKKLRQENLAATNAELLLEISRLEEELARTDQTLDDLFEMRGVTRTEFEKELVWKLSWRRYLDQYLTDENLERFFDERKERFDGTERHICQIVWQVDADAPESQWSSARETAAGVKREIEKSEDVQGAFAQAARQYSDSPSGARGGDVGWYTIDDELPSSVLEAAFALEPAAISPPVATPFGIHLIQVIDVRPGKRTWQQVRPQLKQAAALYLFEWLSNQQRSTTKIRYHDADPHFEAGTDRLADPQTDGR